MDVVASSAVLTFARVEALMPMYAVTREVKTPSTKVIATHSPSVKPSTRAMMGVTRRMERS